MAKKTTDEREVVTFTQEGEADGVPYGKVAFSIAPDATTERLTKEQARDLAQATGARFKEA